MTGSRARFDEVASYNTNGEITGDIITTSKVDNLGYGYAGINADTVNVAGDPASGASKNLRKGIGTILAVYRDVAIDSYYGEAASVINYPISNTSWAAPQAARARRPRPAVTESESQTRTREPSSPIRRTAWVICS